MCSGIFLPCKCLLLLDKKWGNLKAYPLWCVWLYRMLLWLNQFLSALYSRSIELTLDWTRQRGKWHKKLFVHKIVSNIHSPDGVHPIVKPSVYCRTTPGICQALRCLMPLDRASVFPSIPQAALHRSGDKINHAFCTVVHN